MVFRQVSTRHWLFLAAVLIGNGLLLAPNASLPRVVGGFLVALLPGLAWANYLLARASRLTRWTIGFGLSYAVLMITGLAMHYAPGPMPLWSLLLTLNLLTLLPLVATITTSTGRADSPADPSSRPVVSTTLILMVAVLLITAIFRLAGLGYSEFQGDEALAMISASEMLEGHQDALFLRGKGPGEVLVPAVLWRLSGTINETLARLPFSIAGILMVLTAYVLGSRLFGKKKSPNHWAGLAAAGFLALNGFMVGFSRIVQYQVLVVWMSGLALLCVWEWRRTGHIRYMALAGVLLGTGLLAHYDAILVTPAMAYVVWSRYAAHRSNGSSVVFRPGVYIWPVLACIFSLLVTAGLFYVPYVLDPQAARTGGYLGDRIGETLIKNNLASFLHFNDFYTSFYYLVLTGLLVLGYLAWVSRSAPFVKDVPGHRYWMPILVISAGIGLAIRPDALNTPVADLAVLPFALILLAAFLSTNIEPGERTAITWLAVPFLGYNFGVAVPLTHIYTIVPAWTLLAGLAAVKLSAAILPAGRLAPRIKTPAFLVPGLLAVVLASLFGGYLYVAFVRHDIEFKQDWPESRSGVYWSPYQQLPAAGFFGFSHRTGWKTVGGLYALNRLKGDYGSNEEPEITTWYTRGMPRACDALPEYYFVAEGLVDPWPIDYGLIEREYTIVGDVRLANGKGLTIHQVLPASTRLGNLEPACLDAVFDQTAFPSAFARSTRGSRAVQVNFGNVVRLVGYDVDTQRAHPGGRLAVTLYWQLISPVEEDYHAFVHLEDNDLDTHTIWGQADGRPVCWTYPTYDWRPGQIIADQHALAIQEDTPRGVYPLVVGMYLPETGQRLDVLDVAGNPVSTFVTLATVNVE